MKPLRRLRFSHPLDWFKPGIGKPLFPATWEGWVLFLVLLALPFGLMFTGFGGKG